MRTINYGDTLIGQTLSLDFSSLTYNGNLKTTVIAKSKNGSMIKCNTDSNIDYITIQDGSNSTVLYKRTKDASVAEVSLTEYECNSFDDIVYLNTDAFGYLCIKINESANHKPLRINIDETNVYTGKSITATTCKGVGKVRKLTGYSKQETTVGYNLCYSTTISSNNLYFQVDKNTISDKTMTISFITDKDLTHNTIYLSITNSDDTKENLVVGDINGNANTRVKQTFTLSDEAYSKIQSAKSVFFIFINLVLDLVH